MTDDYAELRTWATVRQLELIDAIVKHGSMRHDVGIWVDRDVGRLVVGGALSRLPDGKTEAQVRVGVRF